MNLKNKKKKNKRVHYFMYKNYDCKCLIVVYLYFLSLLYFIQVTIAFSSFLIDHTLEFPDTILNFIQIDFFNNP